MKTEKHLVKDTLTYIMLFIALSLIALINTGCAQLVGIKRYKSGDTVIDFNTGLGFSADVTQSDTLDNNRSIKPAN